MSTRYTEEHEWVRPEGDIVVVGISKYAAEQLGDVVYAELPEIGAHFERGADMAVVESAKTASDVYAPVSGEIVAVNPDIASEKWEIINDAPEGAGWFVKLRPSNASELEALMDEGKYAEYVKGL